MSGKYSNFIPQNCAPPNSKTIGIFNSQNERKGTIKIPSHMLAPSGDKLYSFGALSDVHVTYDTATEDFQKALTYLNNDVDVAFTCICGDLTDDGSAEQLTQYKAIVDGYSADTPVYAISGNHEAYSGGVTTDKIQPYTGQPLYYSFTQDDDVFIMCGLYAWANDYIFADSELQWIYETLEENRNKRCFVFFHVFPWGGSGNAGELYGFDLFKGTQGEVFQSLLRHYKNTIFFHGHSHLKFYLQEVDPKANYSEVLGYRSVHIPSLAVPKDIEGSSLVTVYADSEGYVVDVYEDCIMLRGRDFVKEKFLPIATYKIDTTLQTVEAGTYVDETGVINTNIS